MSKSQLILINITIILSLLSFILLVVLFFVRKFTNIYNLAKYKKFEVSTFLFYSFLLLLSIWALRFGVGYYSIIIDSSNNASHIAPHEEILNSFFKALRTFSMDEDFEQYIISIKSLVKEIVPDGHCSLTIIQTVVVTAASLMNLIAPIISGAIILEILASVFPKIGLRLSYCKTRRPKYYFSELNPASLALAKSIFYKEKDEKPFLIFTDTYVDSENEKEYELLLEAKKYGAICIRDDLSHVVKTRHGKRTYFLMDENEFGNFQTLLGLTDDNNVTFITDSQIFLFVQTDAYVQIEKQINEVFDKDDKKKLLKGGKKPTIVPVSGYRNLVHNLFVEVPLYEPLVHKDDNRLNITILGNGIIGTEAFLSAYWFGQMMISREKDGKKTMSDCEMTINIVSKDSADVFWSKIDYINPEIRGTVVIPRERTPKRFRKILEYNDKGDKNKPYCKVKYIQSDVKIGGFWDEQVDDTQVLLESDYFIVALGNDADNISVANKLRRSIGKMHMEGSTKAKNTVIAYVVFDPELAEKLNGHKKYQTLNDVQTDIYMHAFGSLNIVYSYDNVYMSRFKMLAEAVGAAYDKSQISQKLTDDNDARKGDEKNNYHYWASLARSMHFKYKAFSLGLIEKSIFDYGSDEADDLHKDYVKKQCEKYIKIALAESPQEFSGEILDAYEDAQFKKHLLAWLEHRRWCAFTRTMGYQHTDAVKIFDVKNCQKDMDLKLHSCLVEARRPRLAEGDTYIYAKFLPNGLVDTDTIFKSYSIERLDRLDMVSFERKIRTAPESAEDFKIHDYYRYELYDYPEIDDIAKLLK
ncbi:MAG: hypothetical protein J6S71_04025 [Clostridia bacterium]|nr:hypothetical protein [Clostridia bacterium]